MSWEPTVGTLSDEDLYLAKITIAALGYADVVAHIDALTKQLDHARDIAAALENELAERDAYAAYPQRYVMPMVEPTEAQIAEMQSGAGRWPVRQYATVELPDELLLGDADMHRIGAHIAGSVDVDGQVADAGMGE